MSDNYPLPLPLDEEQEELIAQMETLGCVLASAGSHKFEVLENLVERALIKKTYCPKIADGIYQFELLLGPLSV